MSLEATGERFIPGMGGVIKKEHLHRYFLARQICAGLDVLDAACGEGYGSAMLAEVARSVVGVDIDAATVAHANAKYALENLRFAQGDCARLPLKDDSVDLVVSFETIEHHDRHEEMMREIRRVLRPGGVLLISSPNRPEYDKTLSEPNPFHVKELDFEEFAQLLRRHFANMAFYAQRVVSGSLIVPYGHDEGGFADFEEGGKAYSPGLSSPIYFVALASDEDVPQLGASVFEAEDAAGATPRSGSILEARVYFVGDVRGDYDQAHSEGVLYAADGERRTVEIEITATGAPARLRLDPADAPCAIELYGVALQDAEGAEIWRWQGGCDGFRRMAGVFCRTGRKGVELLCLNDDPQLELVVPPEVFSRVAGGSLRLVLEMAARPLLEALPRVLAEMQAKASGAGVPAMPRAGMPVGFAGHLAEIADLLRGKIEQKNAMIAAQRAEIESLRARQQALYEQLIRAEAQLELLKEFALPEGTQRIERL